MSKTEDIERRRVRTLAVDEEYEKMEEFKVDKRRIVIVDDDPLRLGGYGIVQRAELHHSVYLPTWLALRRYGPPQPVAVKQIKVSVAGPDLKRAFTKEILVWSRLKAHPGIARFLGFYADFKRGEAWLLSPWEPNGNICEFIQAHNLEIPERFSLVYDTIEALAFLHQLDPPVCHGDIKSVRQIRFHWELIAVLSKANVLVSAKFKAVLCDFGLARLYEDSGFGRLETSTGFKGSLRWCSPEIIDGAPRAPTSDVYSWAWLVWEIMTGELPYEGTSADFAVMRRIFDGPLSHVDGKSRLSDCLQIWDLITRCWNVDPLQRPTARMCKTTITYLPRCTPAPAKADHQTPSAALLENLGDLETWRGNPEKGSEYLDEALRLYQKEADAKGIASVLRKQTVAACRISDWVKLGAIATTALEQCRTLNDSLGIAGASYYIGYSVSMLGDLDGGLAIFRESLETYRTLGDDVGVVQCLERIGDIHNSKSNEEEALSTLAEAVEIASRSGDRLGLASVLHMMGCTYIELSDYVKAGDALSEAIVINRNVGWDGELCNALLAMGRLKKELGDYREAEENLQESISIARRIRDLWGIADGLKHLGECLQNQSKLDEAAAAFEESCLLWQQQSQPLTSTGVASYLVGLKSSQGDWDRACFWLDHMIAVFRSQKDHGRLAYQLARKGQILARAQRFDEAAIHFEAGITISIENGYAYNEELEQLCAVPKTAMKWERRLPLLCDVKKLQRRLPQFTTAALKLPIPMHALS